MSNKVKISFFGAAGTVTGSRFLLETPEYNILVDSGMFQGLKELRKLNWENFPFPPKNIDIVLLTHGHLDHSGYLPRLVMQGFNGKVLGTSPSLAIASIILRDSAKIQEEDAERANKEDYSSHTPALPFYNMEQAEKAISLFEKIEPENWVQLSENIKVRFRKNGHILGATFIELDVFGKIWVFSGDIGREQDLLLEPPRRPQWADYLILESTYGDRQHPVEDVDEVLSSEIEEVINSNGSLIIPSFAVERLQSLMFKLWQLYKKNKIPNIPIFIDSPMGNEVLDVFERFPQWHKLEINEFQQMKKHFKIVTSYKDTWKTIDYNRPKVVIAGSGMVTGGRVLTYLRYYLEKPETTVLLVGFQAEGTRGRQLLEGSQEIKIFGKYCQVKAKILHFDSLSAHADQAGLLAWTSEIKNLPEQVFLVHGEPHSRDALRVKLKDVYKWNVSTPKLNESFLVP
ncbi:MBL fold metallo-hydrolase RNA specificity domain-containing protein [Salegentibacter sediminis]|uniref:MBL fold metallo-hydrolase RNA specificity domain-containing protein n=1 Tax=Salegentibacter sediminis TaxID=1930251 RepID=UPI0009BC983E|nr:MBL fold metallo-hydrolase [Salegentibacter sediminis]